MTEFINIDNENYPKLLKNIKNPPQKLYYKGNLSLLNSLCFSVVGSRDLTEYGKRIEKHFIKSLALRGITIVSRYGTRS